MIAMHMVLGRINIRECEACLVMNSSISFCEYYLGVKETYKRSDFN